MTINAPENRYRKSRKSFKKTKLIYFYCSEIFGKFKSCFNALVKRKRIKYFFDSERREECVGVTLNCIYFFHVCNQRFRRKGMVPIFTHSIIFW